MTIIATTCRSCGQAFAPSHEAIVAGAWRLCPACQSIQAPRIAVTITRGRDAWLLEFRCPWCKRDHTHGGGKLDEVPMLGHRVSHCRAEGAPDGYELVAALKANTAAAEGTKHNVGSA